MVNLLHNNLPVYSSNYFLSPALRISSILLLILISFGACKDTIDFDSNSQGCIEYDITYLQNSLKTVPTELLPKKMVFTFRDNCSFQKIEGFLGFFSISHLVNPRQSINSTFLKIRQHKYSYPGHKYEMAVGFDKMDGMEITYLDETKEIAGFNAKKARISFPGQDRNPFDVYYTQDISIKNPNSTNPFHEIDGVLLEFHLKFHNLDMHLMAKNAVFKSISRKEFRPLPEYKAIPRSEMERIIGLLLE
jgi:hypothetical protein